ncbi:NADH-quinone oxidoreductase subunit K [Salinarimonas sp.]|uniref:NADH-quinone oxidoreductase subunit K n=1 Tax=Salinarimonas sp. TaxID=2766526 RepID=UPI0032D8E87D
MSPDLAPNATLYALVGAALVGLGLYGLVARRHPLRRLVGFNVMGSGLFIVFGATGTAPGLAPDPVPQALIITGIVVAFSATALITALAGRYAALTGRAGLPEETPPPDGDAAGRPEAS